MTHSDRRGALRYLLSVPEAAATQPTPVLCFLHGYNEGAPTELRAALTRHGPLRADNPPDIVERFTIIAPQLPRCGDLWHRYADDVAAILQGVQADHNGDRSRSYLTGFSFGANGVFDLSLQQPHTWAALWPVDPTRVPVRDPDRPIWLSLGAVARPAARRFVEALSLTAWSDGLSVDRICLDEGADHVASATRAYRDRRIYAWLLSKARMPTTRAC